MQTTNNGTGKGLFLVNLTDFGTSVAPGGWGRLRVSVASNLRLKANSPSRGTCGVTRPPGIDGQAIEPGVQYVEKITQHCDPDMYRQFLDILSRYHNKSQQLTRCTSLDNVRLCSVAQIGARLMRSRFLPFLSFEPLTNVSGETGFIPNRKTLQGRPCHFRVLMPDRSQQLLGDSPTHSRPGTPFDKSRRKLDVVASSSSSVRHFTLSSFPRHEMPGKFQDSRLTVTQSCSKLRF